jgi:hypothetical protein
VLLKVDMPVVFEATVNVIRAGTDCPDKSCVFV